MQNRVARKRTANRMERRSTTGNPTANAEAIANGLTNRFHDRAWQKV